LDSTWVGDKNEKWSPAQGIDSVLHSIQSLMSPNPFVNEPSFEDNNETDKHKAYSDKIKHETIRISVLQTLDKGFTRKGKSNFDVNGSDELSENVTSALSEVTLTDTEQQVVEFCRRMFLWYYDFYLETIDRESKSHKDHRAFDIAEFEAKDSNQMAGVYQYSTLLADVIEMKNSIDEQIAHWIQQGVMATYGQTRTSEHVMADYTNIIDKFSSNDNYHVDLNLPDIGNRFDWNLTIFSDPDSLLDGAVITVRVIISQMFPYEQPHVQVLTPIFHYRITRDGTFAYMIQGDRNKLEDHINSIVKAVLEPYPAVDQRFCANIEASKLLWGSEELKISLDHKEYRRRVRRSAQKCLEYDHISPPSSTATPSISEFSPASSMVLSSCLKYVKSLNPCGRILMKQKMLGWRLELSLNTPRFRWFNLIDTPDNTINSSFTISIDHKTTLYNNSSIGLSGTFNLMICRFLKTPLQLVIDTPAMQYPVYRIHFVLFQTPSKGLCSIYSLCWQPVPSLAIIIKNQTLLETVWDPYPARPFQLNLSAPYS
jgi:ubiquitin-conjugating enzyme E2 Z